MPTPVPASDLPDNLQQVPASDLPDQLRQQPTATAPVPQKPQADSLGGEIAAPYETLLHEGTQAASAIPAGVASASELATAPAGTKAKRASEASQAVSSALTYEPRSKTGQQMSETVDALLGLPGFVASKAGGGVTALTGSAGAGATADVAIQAIPVLLGARSGVTAEAAEESAAQAARVTARAAHYIETQTKLSWNDLTDSFKSMLINIAKDGKDLEGLDPRAVEREARAQKLGVPITRGQATRDLSQITKEEGLRKADAGKELREIQAEQDRALYSNLDVLRGEAGKGSKVNTPSDVGKSVQGVLRRKLELLEKQKNELYEKAKKAGETQMPVDLTPLKQWLDVPANARNAGFLKSAIEDYEQKGTANVEGKPQQFGTGQVTINDLEEIRKEAVARAMGPRSAETHYAGQAIGVIDDILDQSGANVYKAARAANKEMKDEFDRQGMIRKLAGEKAGTTDRAVALEDTLDHVVIRGSTEDLQKVKQSLLTGDTRAQGARAWADLQAGAIDYLKLKAGGRRGIQGEEGQGQFNSTFLDALHDLDRDGKLDTLFSPRVAERIRLLAKTVHDVRTTPAGRISGSDTVPRIISILEKAKHIPVVGPVTRAIISKGRELYERGKQANEAEQASRAPAADLDARARGNKVIDRAKKLLPPAAIGATQTGIDAQDFGDQGP